MISKLENKIALRYLRTRKKDGFLNVISIFSFIGISLGVAVLIIVMSVMNGFRSELINKIVGFNSHIIVHSYGKATKDIFGKEIDALLDVYLETNSGEVVLIKENFTKGLSIRGYKSTEINNLPIFKNNLTNIEFNNEKNIIVGKELGFDLDMKVGDKILIMSPKGEETIIGNLPKQEIFEISGFFESGLVDFDRNVAFMSIDNLENLLNLNQEQRNLEIFLKNPINIKNAKKFFERKFNNNLIYTWADLNKPLFSALKVERNVMFIILSLIIIVATFNIISGLTILVKNKTKEIAVLKSIGVLNKSITKIFFLVGFYIGLTATIFGVLIGVAFSIYVENIRTFLSEIFNISLFPEEIYFLSKMPSEIDPQSIILISFCSIISTVIVSIFPATQAAKLDAVKTLKYE